jgi:hypothetical protein
MSGEYIVLEYCEWVFSANLPDRIGTIIENNREKQKKIVALNNSGEISEHSLPAGIVGILFKDKYVSEEEWNSVEQRYNEWKQNEQNE